VCVCLKREGAFYFVNENVGLQIFIFKLVDGPEQPFRRDFLLIPLLSCLFFC